MKPLYFECLLKTFNEIFAISNILKEVPQQRFTILLSNFEL